MLNGTHGMGKAKKAAMKKIGPPRKEPKKLTMDDIRKIQNKPDYLSFRAVAEMHGISMCLARKIYFGYVPKYITKPPAQ